MAWVDGLRLVEFAIMIALLVLTGGRWIGGSERGLKEWRWTVDKKLDGLNGLTQASHEAALLTLQSRVEHIHAERKDASHLEAEQRLAIVDRSDRVYARADEVGHLAERIKRLEARFFQSPGA